MARFGSVGGLAGGPARSRLQGLVARCRLRRGGGHPIPALRRAFGGVAGSFEGRGFKGADFGFDPRRWLLRIEIRCSPRPAPRSRASVCVPCGRRFRRLLGGRREASNRRRPSLALQIGEAPHDPLERSIHIEQRGMQFTLRRHPLLVRCRGRLRRGVGGCRLRRLHGRRSGFGEIVGEFRDASPEGVDRACRLRTAEALRQSGDLALERLHGAQRRVSLLRALQARDDLAQQAIESFRRLGGRSLYRLRESGGAREVRSGRRHPFRAAPDRASRTEHPCLISSLIATGQARSSRGDAVEPQRSKPHHCRRREARREERSARCRPTRVRGSRITWSILADNASIRRSTTIRGWRSR